MFFLRDLLHENLFGLLVSEEFVDFLGQFRRLELLAHLHNKFETLTEVHLVHVIENLLFLVTHNANSDSIHNLLIIRSLHLSDLSIVKDSLTLGELIVVLGPEVLECFPG